MNEELRIIIKAVTEEAQRNIQAVRKEIEGIQKSSKDSSKQVDVAMKAMGKSVVAAVAAVATLTTAMASLGKAAQEVQKGFAKLNTTFANAGMSASQASSVYKDLFSFLGEHDEAIEAAQSLALITSNEKDLAEWTHILQGAFAEMGTKLPIDSLAEAANETINVGKVVGVMADALTWAGVSEDGFNQALAQTTSLSEREALVRNTLNGLYGNSAKIYSQLNQSTIAYNKSQADLNIALASTSAYVTPLLTSLNVLSSTMLTALAPAIQVVSLYLTAFIQLIAEAIVWVANFFGIFGGGVETTTADIKGYQNAMNSYLQSLQGGFSSTNGEIKDTINNVNKLKRATMGFDELNVVSNPASGGGGVSIPGVGGGGGGTGITPPNPADYGIGENTLNMDEFKESLSEAKEHLKAILALVGLIGIGMIAWKIGDLLSGLKDLNKLKNMPLGELANLFDGDVKKGVKYIEDATASITSKLKTIGGVALIIVGAIALVKGYSDAWANGIDWKNFSLILGGIAAIVGGIALAFGPLAAAIALVVGGVAALVIGIKDLITNGYSMEGVLMVLAGAVAVVVGVLWAFNAALLANPITWIVIAIMALVAVFVILWNECEGFRNFWIGLWEKAKELFAAFVESIRPLIDAIVNAFQQAWELIKVIWTDYLVPMFKFAWEAIKAIWDLVKPYFEMLWNNIKTIFSVVKTVLGGFFKSAWEVIKGVWDVVVSYFTMIWNNIALVFSAVRKVLSGDFQGAWDDIKKIFSNVGSFFSGVWDTIKRVFSNVGKTIADTISNTVKTAINGVLSSAVSIINGFISAINFAISIINAIPGVNISKLSKLEVPKLATGGIVSGATLAMIGERGKEAVLPLENNTEWMDALADRIAARNQTPTKVVLQVGERELGYATINSINGITKQTGNLQLVMP